MKFEIIFLGLVLLMARADMIYSYSKPLQIVPTTTYATTSSYYMPGSAVIPSFARTAPILQATQTNVQSNVVPTLLQSQSYIQPVNTFTASATRYGFTQGTNTVVVPASSYALSPAVVSTQASSNTLAQTSTSVPAPTPTPIPIPTQTQTQTPNSILVPASTSAPVSTPVPAPAPAPTPASVPVQSPAQTSNTASTPDSNQTPIIVDQLPPPPPTYSPTLSKIGSLQMPTTQPLTQPVPPPTSYSSSISSQIPNYSTLNSISGVNNAILGVNNSGSGNNNLINGENNCLTGDSNVLVGGNNLVSGSSNTILGSQNCVTGSSNTVLPLPSNMQTSPSLAMGSNVITSGTLPPPPTTSLI